MAGNLTMVWGYVRQGPEPLGDNGCKFAIPVTEKWTKDGEQKESTEWFNVIVNGKQAASVLEYIKTGDWVTVHGKQQTRKVGDKTYVNCIAQRVDFGPRGERQEADDEPDSGCPF